MQSTINESAKSIVKEYFNNAIIIDDELEVVNLHVDTDSDKQISGSLKHQQLGEVTNEQIDFSDFEDEDYNEGDQIGLKEVIIGGKESAAATVMTIDESKSIENKDAIITHSPFEVFSNFIETGIVTFPYKYNQNKKVEENISKIKNVLSNTKILIIDWEMETNTGVTKPGYATKEIIKSLLNQETGLKCAVIYTKGNIDNVLESLKQEYEIVDQESYFFQNKKENVDKGCSLFGFVMDKKVSPDQIISKIAEILVRDKSTTLHFMECANKLDSNLHKTLQKFNAPFEKVLFSQIFTSDIPNEEISPFINNTLLSNVIDEFTIKSDTHFLFEWKREKLIILFNQPIINKSIISELVNILTLTQAKKIIEEQFQKQEFIDKLKDIIKDSEINSFESFKLHINNMCKEYTQGSKKHNQIVNELVLFIMLLDNFISETKESNSSQSYMNFKESYLEETVLFTWIMKYHSVTSQIQTGTILKQIDSINNNITYLYCITPLCDITRLENIGNKYKFIIGTEVKNISESTLKNGNSKEHCTAVPDIGNKKLIFVKWNFYDVKTIDKELIEKDIELKKNMILGTLKIEYAQNIINRYIAYQSRAGVYEMFYKETDYISNFMKIINSPSEPEESNTNT
ncbi:response regulator receiver domain [Paenibacillus sp. N1-5-1-14]|uniref:response regulator receiver domain n=1 Tax=Paenibacillus radicibacter TaxID=2972488 RepID=UPI0021592F50|nr:response regulator receiver domain [Paenibacillus radicibacter]MCR8644718.1 response regulator receiver domain [Paenibacillus radicibacter]